MQDNMNQIEQTEAVIDNERTALKAHIGQIEAEEKSLENQIFELEKQLRAKDKEYGAVKRDGERRIDAQKDQIFTLQNASARIEKLIAKEEKKIEDHQITKCKNAEYLRLSKELEAIEKNNQMLKLIELQYEREIERRLKQEQKVKLEEEIGEKVIDSPLRRAREYACSIAGSPSPVRRIVTKGTFQFEISPEKTELRSQKPPIPEERKPSQTNAKAGASETKKSVFGIEPKKSMTTASGSVTIKQVKNLRKQTSMVTPEKRVANLGINTPHQRSVSKPGYLNSKTQKNIA